MNPLFNVFISISERDIGRIVFLRVESVAFCLSITGTFKRHEGWETNRFSFPACFLWFYVQSALAHYLKSQSDVVSGRGLLSFLRYNCVSLACESSNDRMEEDSSVVQREKCAKSTSAAMGSDTRAKGNKDRLWTHAAAIRWHLTNLWLQHTFGLFDYE